MNIELGYREKQIARLMLRGHINKEIAETLGLTVKTATATRERCASYSQADKAALT